VDITEKSVAHIEEWVEKGFKELAETYLFSGCEWIEGEDEIRPVMHIDKPFALQAGLSTNIVLLLPPIKYIKNKLQ
jgi:hypothetical protein